jgi:pyruvate,water dikinase
VSAYLDLVGYRLVDGFDISGRYALELPDALLRAIRVSLESQAPGASDREDQVADVRAKVPEAHRDQFDELLREARLTYKIRDELGVFSDIWASGIMRRAVIACGRRLASDGRAHDAEHLVDADLEEMRSLLSARPSRRRTNLRPASSSERRSARRTLRPTWANRRRHRPIHLNCPPGRDE